MTAPTPAMSWRRSALAVVAVVPILLLLLFGIRQDPQAKELIESPLPGKEAPDFALKRMDNGQIERLGARRGEVLVLNFWASWCGPCRLEHDALVQTSNAYAGKGVQFFGILQWDSIPGANLYFQQMGNTPYPTLLSEQSHVGVDYGITGLPETFIIDRRGVVAYKRTGPWTADSMAMVIDSVLAAR